MALTDYHYRAFAADVQRRIGLQSMSTVGDPVTVLTFIATILPTIGEWVQTCRGWKDEDVAPNVQAMYAKSPAATISRLARKCKAARLQEGREYCREMRLRGKERTAAMAGFRLSNKDADNIARGLIEECCSRSADDVARYVRGS